MLPRPPHPVPNVRDDRETPLVWDGMARVVELIWVTGEAEYFSAKDWTPQITLIVNEIFAPARTRPQGGGGRFSQEGGWSRLGGATSGERRTACAIRWVWP